MNPIYRGKTKDVYDIGEGRYLLQFKDDVTGTDGKFDPGANTVGLSIEGMGNACVRLTNYFYRRLASDGIPTHFIDADLQKSTMTVKAAKVFGKGLEVICRFKAVGSFLRRYGDYITEGADLDAFVEVTLKNDDRGDPPLTDDALEVLGIMTKADYAAIKDLTKKISRLIKGYLKELGAELYDIKLEFGKAGGEVILIDEISAGNMRVYKSGKIMEPLDIAGLIK